MPHIGLHTGQPGIRGPAQYRPETGRPLSELAGTQRLVRDGYLPPPTGDGGTAMPLA
jgi:hypothetical protein